MVTQMEIARHVGLDVSSVNKILNKRQGPVFKKQTIKRVFKAASDLGFRFDRLKHVHRRRHPRKTVVIPAQFIIHSDDGSLYDTGDAVIRDISTSGAHITDVMLPKGTLPVTPFSTTLKYKPNAGASEVERRGTPIRLRFEGDKAVLSIDFAP